MQKITPVKNLPSKKDLKEYYKLRYSDSFKITKITYEKNHIWLDCKLAKKQEYFIASFYQNIEGFNMTKRTFLLSIKNEHFNHVINFVKLNLQYLRDTNNSHPKK